MTNEKPRWLELYERLTTVPDQLERNAEEFWKAGARAIQRENWNLAIEMYSKAVRLVPGELKYRQMLRGSAYRKYNNRGGGVYLSWFRLMEVRRKIKRAAKSMDWNTVDEVAERGLRINPWDAQLEACVGDACRELGFREIAIFAYSNAAKLEKGNVHYMQKLASLHSEIGNDEEASRLWMKINQMDAGTN